MQNPVSLAPSIDPDSHGGRGTLQRSNGDRGLDAGNALSVKKTVRGMTEVAPMERTRPDLVAGAQRMHVSARSGNDSRLLDDPGTPNGGMWDSVGMGDAPAATATGGYTLQKTILVAAIVGGIWFLAKGGR